MVWMCVALLLPHAHSRHDQFLVDQPPQRTLLEQVLDPLLRVALAYRLNDLLWSSLRCCRPVGS